MVAEWGFHGHGRAQIRQKYTRKTNVCASGEESSLDAITKIPANISVTGVTKETKVKVPLSASGVNLDPKEVEVTLIPVKKE